MPLGCESRTNAGILQYFLGSLKEAYREFEEALKLCPSDPNAVLWKGKVELMMGQYDKAINTLRQSDSAEGRLWLSLALYLYSFLLDIPERDRALKEALHYALTASIDLAREDANLGSGVKLSEVAKLVAVLVLTEQGRTNEAWNLSTGLKFELQNLGEIYLSLRRKNYSWFDLKVYSAKYDLGRVSLNDRPLYGLLEGLADLAKVRKLLEEAQYRSGALSEALSALTSVTSPALRPLVLLYEAEVQEMMNNDVAACMAYSEVIKFVDSPLVRGRLSQCVLSAPQGAVQASPVQDFDPDALIGREYGMYRIEEKLACGGLGCVYKAKAGDDYYAIKVLQVGVNNSSNSSSTISDPKSYFQDLLNEANNLVNLSNHPNIVRVYAVSGDVNVIDRALRGDYSQYYSDPPRIVMEFMGGGSLDKYMNDDTFFYSSSWEKAVIKAVRQVAEALAYMHGKGYIHSDVKPQNIFLTKKPKDPSDLLSVDFKLGDLGSAVRVGKGVVQATPEYYPPEIFTDTAKPSMDVFALGITLYVLLTRKNDRPDSQTMNVAVDCYTKNNDMNCVRQKVEESKRLLASWDPSVQEPFKTLIKRMTDPDPTKRPTADGVAKELSKLQP